MITIGCTSADKFDDRDKREPSASAIKYRFDNFLLDTTLTVSLEEFPLDSNEKQLLIEKVIEHYDYYLESDWALERKALIENFKFLDLNGDGKPDMLFQGWSGGEPECVKIHFSNDTGFASPVNFYQYLKEIEVEDGKIKSLTMLNPGCCAEYVEQELVYTFDKELKHKLTFHRARIGALPDKYEILDIPIGFSIENDVYKLRGEPKIDESGTFVYDYVNEGNMMAIFERGTTRRAWAKDNSDPDREWWYVEMEPIKDSLDFDMFKYYDEQGLLRRMGWMSSRFLKEIE